jgi:preprotein translocase subunit SecG
MDTLNTLALVAHVLIAATIIGLVLIQKGKGADAGAGFGAGASGTVFGARGSANFLSRSTAVAATLFFMTSLGLAYLNSNRTPETSLLDELSIEAEAGEAVDENELLLDSIDSLDLPPLTDSGQAEERLNSEDMLPVVPELQESSQ